MKITWEINDILNNVRVTNKSCSYRIFIIGYGCQSWMENSSKTGSSSYWHREQGQSQTFGLIRESDNQVAFLGPRQKICDILNGEWDRVKFYPLIEK